MNWYKIAQQNNEMYFLRYTSEPERDLARGWSCYVHGWARDEDAVKRYYEYFKIPVGERNPKYDEIDNLWCVIPEEGLSAYGFYDEESFEIARENVGAYYGFGESQNMSGPALFKSNNYKIGAGSDEEDVFLGGTFLGFLSPDAEWEDFMTSLDTSVPEITNRRDVTQDLDRFVEDDLDDFEEFEGRN